MHIGSDINMQAVLFRRICRTIDCTTNKETESCGNKCREALLKAWVPCYLKAWYPSWWGWHKMIQLPLEWTNCHELSLKCIPSYLKPTSSSFLHPLTWEIFWFWYSAVIVDKWPQMRLCPRVIYFNNVVYRFWFLT